MDQSIEIVVIEGSTLGTLRDAGWRIADDRLPGVEATALSAPGIAATELAGHVVIVDPVMETGAYAPAIATSLRRRVFAATFGADADVWVWRAETEHGNRELAWIGGDLGHESGEPHPAEEGLGHLDEDVLWALLERATSVDETAIATAQYRVVELPEGLGEEAD